MSDGLKEETRRRILVILTANPRVERVVLFGSRAMGSHTATSDIDLALFGPALTLKDQAQLAGELDSLPIPQRVDLVRYATILNAKLRDHILERGVEWFSRI